MEIDMPEWFDVWIGQPINWAMSSDLIGIPNIWLVVAGLFFLILLIGLGHQRRERRRRKAKRAAEARAAAEDQQYYEEPDGFYSTRFSVPGDED